MEGNFLVRYKGTKGKEKKTAMLDVPAHNEILDVVQLKQKRNSHSIFANELIRITLFLHLNIFFAKRRMFT